MPSPALTTEFLEKVQGVDLAALFAASIRKLAAKDLPDAEVRKLCAKDMRERLIAKADMTERALSLVNFEIFVNEAVEALRPLRVSITTRGGKIARLALPADIPGVAEKIAASWQDAAKITRMMTKVAAEGKRQDIDTEHGNIACERVKAGKSGPEWEKPKGILHKMFTYARNTTFAVVALAGLVSGMYSVQLSLAPNEANRATLSELEEGFGVEARKSLGTQRWREGVENAMNDTEFDALIKEDFLLSRLMSGLDELPNAVEKCHFVNRFWNSLRGAHDIDQYGEDEYWAKPSEMWKNFGGDCEDYVLAKYVTLRKAGFDKEDLHILCTESRDGVGHALLAVKTESGYKVLDNLSKDMLTLEEAASRYKLRDSLNEQGSTAYKIKHTASMRM